MNPSTLMKFGALGVGAYLLYQHFGASPLSSSAATTGTSSTTSTTSTGTSSSANAGTTTTTAAAIAAAAATGPFANTPEANNGIDVQYKRAAAWAGWAKEAGDKRLDWHQWMYYRQRWNDTLPRPASEDVGQGEGLAKMTATEFHAILAAKGLAGLAIQRALYA